MRKPRSALRNALLLLACIIVFLAGAAIIANLIAGGSP